MSVSHISHIVYSWPYSRPAVHCVQTWSFDDGWCLSCWITDVSSPTSRQVCSCIILYDCTTTNRYIISPLHPTHKVELMLGYNITNLFMVLAFQMTVFSILVIIIVLITVLSTHWLEVLLCLRTFLRMKIQRVNRFLELSHTRSAVHNYLSFYNYSITVVFLNIICRYEDFCLDFKMFSQLASDLTSVQPVLTLWVIRLYTLYHIFHSACDHNTCLMSVLMH